jgi:hypothetical protein
VNNELEKARKNILVAYLSTSSQLYNAIREKHDMGSRDRHSAADSETCLARKA